MVIKENTFFFHFFGELQKKKIWASSSVGIILINKIGGRIPKEENKEVEEKIKEATERKWPLKCAERR